MLGAEDLDAEDGKEGSDIMETCVATCIWLYTTTMETVNDKNVGSYVNAGKARVLERGSVSA
jgi:hypothetical protein